MFSHWLFLSKSRCFLRASEGFLRNTVISWKISSRMKGLSFFPAAACTGNFMLAKKQWTAVMLNQTLWIQYSRVSPSSPLCGQWGRSHWGLLSFSVIIKHSISANVCIIRHSQVLHWQSRWQSQGILVNFQISVRTHVPEYDLEKKMSVERSKVWKTMERVMVFS